MEHVTDNKQITIQIQIQQQQQHHFYNFLLKCLETPGTQFLVGESLTIADLPLFESLLYVDDYVGREFLQGYPKLQVTFRSFFPLVLFQWYLASSQLLPCRCQLSASPLYERIVWTNTNSGWSSSSTISSHCYLLLFKNWKRKING